MSLGEPATLRHPRTAEGHAPSPARGIWRGRSAAAVATPLAMAAPVLLEVAAGCMNHEQSGEIHGWAPPRSSAELADARSGARRAGRAFDPRSCRIQVHSPTSGCPPLHPGQIVVVDNVGAHKPERMRALVEDADCRLVFLPACSPDRSPAEDAFSKLKTLIRAATASTRAALMPSSRWPWTRSAPPTPPASSTRPAAPLPKPPENHCEKTYTTDRPLDNKARGRHGSEPIAV